VWCRGDEQAVRSQSTRAYTLLSGTIIVIACRGVKRHRAVYAAGPKLLY
jgi:hypothetical protein